MSFGLPEDFAARLKAKIAEQIAAQHQIMENGVVLERYHEAVGATRAFRLMLDVMNEARKEMQSEDRR